jgi:precorrin-4 C11-methyltransferase
MNTIIVHSDKASKLAEKIIDEGFHAKITRSPKNYETLWKENRALIFIGALGICVREIAPLLKDKKSDPAVINIDANGEFVQPVVSGHLGGANKLAVELAAILGAVPVITTMSDTSGLWQLDLLPERYGWKLETEGRLTPLMAKFVNGEKTALLLEVRDRGTLALENSLPPHIEVFFTPEEIDISRFKLIIAITPFVHQLGNQVIYYRPGVVQIGVGSQAGISPSQFEEKLRNDLKENGIAPSSIVRMGSVDIKQNEEAFLRFSQKYHIPFSCFSAEELSCYNAANPSDKVKEVTGSRSVAEAAAMHLSGNELYREKVKLKAGDKYFTYALAMDKEKERKGFVEFIGAGPGDPELVSVRGKKILRTADMILYAGSLVPRELTYYAKPGSVVKSSACMDLNTQIECMKPFYERGLFIARLHSGDPCIYGAIQEQMAVMDSLGWNYRITPGISSFQAAAAALKSQFTIPEKVQTIILTRGEGRTPVPEKEQLHKLAQSQSTICIYLSATISDKIQAQLEKHYPPDTPVAICYKLTWKDEKIYRCTLNDLAKTVENNKLTMTTLIVVGKAIDNRSGLSKLYDRKFSHAFREGE